jgi:general secretion pathway protein H
MERQGVKVKTKTLPAGENRGFTLLELLIVLLIISIAGALTLLSIDIAHKKTILRDAARKTFLYLRHAREVSITNRTPVVFEIDKEGKGYVLKKKTGTLIRTYILPQGLWIEGEDIEFRPFGDSTGGRILLKDRDERIYEIRVDSITGKVSLQKIQ